MSLGQDFKLNDKVRFKEDGYYGDVWTIIEMNDIFFELKRNDNNFTDCYPEEIEKIETDNNGFYIQNIKSCFNCKNKECNLNISPIGICDLWSDKNEI